MPSKQEVRHIVEDYAQSGMTRRRYCQQHDIPISTLDYWRRVHQRMPRLVQVAVEGQQPAAGFTLVLANGRRIESGWRFADGDLVRLIRAAEA